MYIIKLRALFVQTDETFCITCSNHVHSYYCVILLLRRIYYLWLLVQAELCTKLSECVCEPVAVEVFVIKIFDRVH